MIEQYKLAYLKESWKKLMGSHIFRASTDNTRGTALNILLDLYSDPRRKYHNLNHIWSCLQQATNFGLYQKQEYDLLRIAIWFHDAFYTCSPGHDEDMSQQLLRNLFPESFENISEVCFMIECTKNHGSQTNFLSPTCKNFLNIDMSILGTDPEIYTDYSKSVVREYLAFHPDTDIKHILYGRRAFLVKLIESKIIIIYNDKLIDKHCANNNKLNDKALSNIQREFEILSTMNVDEFITNYIE